MKSYITKQPKQVRERVEAKLDQTLVRTLEQYCQYLDSDRDYVISQALGRLPHLRRTKGFAEWLSSQRSVGIGRPSCQAEGQSRDGWTIDGCILAPRIDRHRDERARPLGTSGRAFGNRRSSPAAVPGRECSAATRTCLRSRISFTASSTPISGCSLARRIFSFQSCSRWHISSSSAREPRTVACQVADLPGTGRTRTALRGRGGNPSSQEASGAG